MKKSLIITLILLIFVTNIVYAAEPMPFTIFDDTAESELIRWQNKGYGFDYYIYIQRSDEDVLILFDTDLSDITFRDNYRYPDKSYAYVMFKYRKTGEGYWTRNSWNYSVGTDRAFPTTTKPNDIAFSSVNNDKISLQTNRLPYGFFPMPQLTEMVEKYLPVAMKGTIQVLGGFGILIISLMIFWRLLPVLLNKLSNG